MLVAINLERGIVIVRMGHACFAVAPQPVILSVQARSALIRKLYTGATVEVGNWTEFRGTPMASSKPPTDVLRIFENIDCFWRPPSLYLATSDSKFERKNMLPLSKIFQLSLLIVAATFLTAFSQSQINLDAFDDTAVPADIAIHKGKVAEGIERIGFDPAGRVHFEMTVDESGNLLKGTTALKYVYDANGNHSSMLIDENGESIPRVKVALYCFIIPNPSSRFLRKAWLDKNGSLLDEERRVYERHEIAFVQSHAAHSSSSSPEEYRHRYRDEGKFQFTFNFLNGAQSDSLKFKNFA